MAKAKKSKKEPKRRTVLVPVQVWACVKCGADVAKSHSGLLNMKAPYSNLVDAPCWECGNNESESRARRDANKLIRNGRVIEVEVSGRYLREVRVLKDDRLFYIRGEYGNGLIIEPVKNLEEDSNES